MERVRGWEESMNKARVFKVCTALLIFVIMLGAGLFYLRYEGVTQRQYVLDQQPDLSLTVEDAVQVIRPQAQDDVTEYHLDHTLVYEPQMPVAAVRVIYSELPESRMNASISHVPREGQSAIWYVRSADNVSGSKEILFTFPRIDPSELRITVHDAADVSRIELYQSSAYVDESKHVPQGLNTGIAILLAALLALVYLASDADLKKGRGLVFPVLYFVLELGVLSFCLQSRGYEAYSRDVEIAVYVIFALATPMLCLAYRMLFVKNMPVHYAFAVGALTLGVILMLLIQPYTALDEKTHFGEAYRFSNRLMGATGEREDEIRWEDLRFQEKQEGEFGQKNSYERYGALMEDFSLINKAEGMKRIDSPEADGVPLGYVVTGAAITVARLLNLSGMALFYFGRLANLIVYVILISLVICLIPFGKAAVMCIAIAPVSLHLAASYSYDPIVTAFAFLYVAYVLRLWAQEEQISLRQFVVCCVLGALLAPSKIAYAPMTAAVFLIPAKKYAFGGRKKWMINFVVVALSFAVLFAMQSGSIGRVSQASAVDWADGAPGYSLTYLIANIRETINLYLRTIDRGADWFTPHIFSGMMGWAQLYTYDWVMILYYILFFVGCQQAENEPKICCKPYMRWYLLIIAGGVVAIIMLSMLLGYTPMGSYSIQGVQGRYFIPVMILLVPIIRNAQIGLSDRVIRWCGFAALWAGLYAAANLLWVMPRLMVLA